MSKSRWVCVATLALLVSAAGLFWREPNQPWQAWLALSGAVPNAAPADVRALVPARTGKPELCVACHMGIEDISPSHSAQAIGCVVCHGGEPLARDADRAHAGMRGGRNPSDPTVAVASCGQDGCHGGHAEAELNHVDRVHRSLMATYAGGIALVRFTFGAQPSLAAQFAVRAQEDRSGSLPASALASLEQLPSTARFHSVDPKLQGNCLSGGCHLSSPPWPQTYYYRSTGCAACHYLYADDGLYRGSDPTISPDQPGHGTAHRLTTAITFGQCNHCHNRGNYSLKQMAFLPREDLPPVAAVPSPSLPAEARRLLEVYQPFGNFTLCECVLECVDCHTAGETMGDGHIHGSKKDILDVQCQTCHGTSTSKPSVATIHDPNELAMRQARLNGRAGFLAPGDIVVQTGRGELLWAVKQTGPTEFVQVSKVDGELYRVPLVLGSKCLQDGETQTSAHCHQCHALSRE